MKGYAGERGRVLIVDGYNVINVRKPVRESRSLEDARRKLTDRLHDYAGWSGQRIVLVYDAWLSDRAQRSVETRGTLEVVFTKKGETADQYIERLCDELAGDVEMRRIELRVATSDLIEQTIAFGRGATRVSSRELLLEMDAASALRGPATRSAGFRGTTVGERLPSDIREKLERMRRGEESPQPSTPAQSPIRPEPKPEPSPPAPEPEQSEPAPKPELKPEQGKAKSRSGRNRNRRKPKPSQAPAKREAKADQIPAPANPQPTGRQSEDRGAIRQTNPGTPTKKRKGTRH